MSRLFPTLRNQTLLILVLALFAGVIRPFFPQAISWFGRWPTASTSALDAYKMMAQPDDPPFASLQDVIAAQKDGVSVLLDARASKDFVKGRIPGSRNLPYYEIEAYQDAALADVKAKTPLIIYCEGIGCELSFFLGRELREVGYENIQIFYGGYPEWSEAGFPIEKDEPQP